MTPPEITDLVISSLLKIAEAAPGFLETFSGQKDDAAALESARVALDAIPLSPARIGIDRRRAELAFQNSKVEMVQAVFFGILRAAEARAAFAEIPIEDGIAVVPVAEAKAHLATLIEKIGEKPRTLSREEVRDLMKEGEKIGEELEKRFTSMERQTDSDKRRAK